MGKLLSKHDCKRRENPEGGSYAANALTCQGERGRVRTSTHAIKRKQEFCGKDLKNTQIHTSDCHLEVALPLERGGDREHDHSHTGSHLPQQEWTFTLHCFDNSGQVTKEGMSRLMHSIYEVMETSIKQPTNGSTGLRVKLVLTPVSQSDMLSQSDHDTGHIQEVGRADRKCVDENRKYCVDENIDRRKHYLDLAGIENYSSQFENTEATSQEPGRVRSAHQRRPVGMRENCSATKSQGRGLSFLRSLRGREAGGGGGGTKSTRFHGQQPQPSLWPQPQPQPQPPLWPQPQPQPQPPLWPQPQPQPALQHARIKRFRSRAQETNSPSRPQLLHHQPPGLQAWSGEGREVFPSQPASYGGLISTAQRHHLHHHEHHHHYYHYPPA